MMYKLSYIFLSFMLLFFSSAFAAGVDQTSDSLGLVVMQAEDYDSLRAGLKGDTFADSTTFVGYYGTSYMQGTDAQVYNPAAQADTAAPALSYTINFTKTGTHYVWAHKYFIDGSNDSFFYGVGDSIASDAFKIQSGTLGAWEWKRADSSLVIPATGAHTLTIYLRERGAAIDAIIVTCSDSFDPTENTVWETWDVASFTQESSSLGLVEMQAEEYDFYRPGIGSKDGDTFTLEDSIDGYVGNGYMRSYMSAGDGSTTNAENINAKLTYKVDFVNTGKQYVWVRAYFPDGSGDSFFMGADGKVNGQINRSSGGQDNWLYGAWYWYKADSSVVVDEPGMHAVNIYQREPKARLDQIIITSSDTYNPNSVWPPKEIVFVSKSSVVDDTGEQADKPFIDDLTAEGYNVTTVYSSSLSTASQGLLDTLNNADLVIIGRSGSSGDFGGANKKAWNNITSPLLNLHPYTARNESRTRLNWLNSATTSAYDTAGDTIVAKIELPDDPVFAGATIAAEDSTMDWVYSPYDYMEITDGGNGTVLARSASDGNVFFVRWDPWVEFYDGAGDYARGYRTLIGNGNDHAYATAGGPWNFYNFTDEAKQVYLNEVARMVELPKEPRNGKVIAFVSKSSVVDDTGEQADKPFIDDLFAEGYEVNTVYSSSLSTASQGLLDTLDNADLVIIGRSGTSGDFGGANKKAWNSITTPLLNLHPYTARNESRARLNWLNTETTSAYDTAGDTIVAKIELPDDPVFAGATIAAEDSTMDWVYSPYDYMGTTDGGNGTVLARSASDDNVFFVRWEAWAEFYEGAGDTCYGFRTLIGNGNDHAYATAGGPWNYYNFTDEAKQVYLNEVARMVKLGKVNPPTSIDGGNSNIPMVYALEQNYPNPFNPETSIKFSLPKAGKTTLKIYNILGQLVTTLVDQDMNAGVHTISFNAITLSSGMYFYRIESGDFIKVKKMMLLK